MPLWMKGPSKPNIDCAIYKRQPGDITQIPFLYT